MPTPPWQLIPSLMFWKIFFDCGRPAMIKVEKDKGWAFVVLFAACGIQLFTAIFTYGSGVMHLYLLDKYRKDDATTSVIGSLFVNLLSVFGLLASYFINKWRCRFTSLIGAIILFLGLTSSSFASSFWILVITNGIISGIGVGLALLPALFAVGVNFEKHSGVAHGMCQAGLGIGMTLSGPFMEYLLREYGLRVIGIGTIISRLVVGVAIGPGGLDPLMLNVALTACMGVVIGTFPFYISSNSGYIIFSVMYGVVSGGLNVFTVPLCVSLAGKEYLSEALGIWFLLLGLGSLIGAPAAGFIFDRTGSYAYSYFIMGMLVLLASFLSLGVALCLRQRKKEQNRDNLSQLSVSVITGTTNTL
ncbi:monocarboxylate transporter 12-like [Saccostrea cucullata]|uniref:monocarboxylate transporter 12-like n=1 Tax=Saccostrea cuccullata TaxID=36930 RepID=UPI002ED60CFD